MTAIVDEKVEFAKPIDVARFGKSRKSKARFDSKKDWREKRKRRNRMARQSRRVNRAA